MATLYGNLNQHSFFFGQKKFIYIIIQQQLSIR